MLIPVLDGRTCLSCGTLAKQSYQTITIRAVTLIRDLLLNRSSKEYFLSLDFEFETAACFIYVISGSGRRLILETRVTTRSASSTRSWL